MPGYEKNKSGKGGCGSPGNEIRGATSSIDYSKSSTEHRENAPVQLRAQVSVQSLIERSIATLVEKSNFIVEERLLLG